MQRSVSIVVPVYNERENIDELVARTVAVGQQLGRPWELVLVDDGSRDGSSERLLELARQHAGLVKALLLNRNYGQHNAILCGFSHAQGDMMITLDADLQNPPEEIPRLVAAIDAGADVVGTVRLHRQDSVFRRLSSLLVNNVVRLTTGVMMSDYGCMLRAYRRRVVEAMLACRERSTFIPVLANMFAKRTAEIEVRHAERTRGESKYSLFKLVNLQFDLLTCMTTTPLRLLSYAGGAIAAAAVGFGALLLVLRTFFGAAWAGEGVFTLFALLFFFVGAQFVAMGLLGEYVGRIHADVRERPRYIVDSVGGETMGETNSGLPSSTRATGSREFR